MSSDSWGKALGADDEVKVVEQPKKKTSLKSLVYYFKETVVPTTMTLSAPVNGIALMKSFKHLRQRGISNEEIVLMIDQFAYDIKQTPLPTTLPAWRGFISRLDSLYEKIKIGSKTYTYDSYTVDKRFKKENKNG